ncbi:K+ transport system, NAD-binding component fusedto Ion channel [Halapricum desulfuricans]|uniref:K+ transport system, NAD-binding component fusedto Ion channel n=1 Tax=Halapricum desulfuricans TaxID=2841257 RepID=A0A897NJZ5_9EURY|nr:NAD-binding protein [Halapricum desulfuricans]QSG11273.1 K+ transport system, NAD-binding component fusedto Ion channel [Halapricum desulfuricans]
MDPLPDALDDISLTRRDRLIIYYIVGLVVLVGTYTLLYHLGMTHLEGDEHSIFRSFQTVVETFTTTGFGADAPWETPWMNLFVVAIQLSGIALGFFTLRVIIIPLFTSAEVNLDNRLTPKRDHVIICEYRRDSEVLLEELEALGIEYVLISSDEQEARQLSDDGYAAIDGSPQQAETFERASIDSARAVITDAGSATVDTILTARSVRPDIEIITLTDDSSLADIFEETGADSVLSPHSVLGYRLAEKIVASFRTELGDAVELGEDIELTEVSIERGSALDGVTIRNSGIREETGANVVGAWIDGELELPPDPDAVIRENSVLLVAGEHEALEELGEFTRSASPFERPDRVVLAGSGEVGTAAKRVLDDAGIETVTIDSDEATEPDVVGDAGERAVLKNAGVSDAGAILVCVPDDSQNLLAAVQAQAINPDIEVLFRANEMATVSKAFRAGADYVLAVPQVSARMVARELRGEDVLAPASQIRVIRVPARPFAGDTIESAEIPERTGCRVVAIEDDSGMTTQIDPGRELDADDRLTLVGTDDAVQEFLKQFDVSPTGL